MEIVKEQITFLADNIVKLDYPGLSEDGRNLLVLVMNIIRGRVQRISNKQFVSILESIPEGATFPISVAQLTTLDSAIIRNLKITPKVSYEVFYDYANALSWITRFDLTSEPSTIIYVPVDQSWSEAMSLDFIWY